MPAAAAFTESRAQDLQGTGPALASTCLLLLIAADLAFVAVHVVNRLSPALGSSALYSLGADGGYAEMFQYLKTYWIAIMLGLLCARTRAPVYAAWSLLYAYLLCDDALRIHETVGGAVAAAWGYGPAFGLRAQDFGELTVSGCAGFALLGMIALLYLRSSAEARTVSRDLALLLAVLVFFGIFVDMLHIMVQGRYLKELFGILEDGGELLAMSASFWYALRLLERRTDLPSLWDCALRAVTPR